MGPTVWPLSPRLIWLLPLLNETLQNKPTLGPKMAPPLKETDQPSHLVGKWLYGTPSTLEGVEGLWLLLIESTIFWYMFAFLTKTQPALLSEGSRVFDPHSYNPHDIVTHITSRAPLRSTRYVSRHMTAGPTGLLDMHHREAAGLTER